MNKNPKVKQPTVSELLNIIKDRDRIIKEYEEWGEHRKKQFAVIFGWFKRRGQYDYLEEHRIPSWEEIFAKIGGLIASEKFSDNIHDLHSLQSQIQNINQILSDKKIIT